MIAELAIHNLSKVFHKGELNEVIALLDINLSFNAGENVIIVGHNGSGKSTLLNIIDGRTQQTTGVIKIDSMSIDALPTYSRAKYIFRLFQDSNHGVVPMATIRENLAMASKRGKRLSWFKGILHGFSGALDSALLEYRPELAAFLDKKVYMLSPGERQAVVLACLNLQMSEKRHILLADEPTASLDPELANLCTKTIRDYSQRGWLCLTVTHEPDLFMQYSTRIIRLAKGKISEDKRLQCGQK